VGGAVEGGALDILVLGAAALGSEAENRAVWRMEFDALKDRAA
jgi:hypothetical protein